MSSLSAFLLSFLSDLAAGLANSWLRTGWTRLKNSTRAELQRLTRRVVVALAACVVLSQLGSHDLASRYPVKVRLTAAERSELLRIMVARVEPESSSEATTVVEASQDSPKRRSEPKTSSSASPAPPRPVSPRELPPSLAKLADPLPSDVAESPPPSQPISPPAITATPAPSPPALTLTVPASFAYTNIIRGGYYLSQDGGYIGALSFSGDSSCGIYQVLSTTVEKTRWLMRRREERREWAERKATQLIYGPNFVVVQFDEAGVSTTRPVLLIGGTDATGRELNFYAKLTDGQVTTVNYRFAFAQSGTAAVVPKQ